MTFVPLQPRSPRRRIGAWMVVAVLVCVGGLVVLALAPEQFRYRRVAYLSGNGAPIASFSLRLFVGNYSQSSHPFDPKANPLPPTSYGGYALVNTVEWDIQARRVAGMLVALGVVLMIRAARSVRQIEQARQ